MGGKWGPAVGYGPGCPLLQAGPRLSVSEPSLPCGDSCRAGARLPASLGEQLECRGASLNIWPEA